MRKIIFFFIGFATVMQAQQITPFEISKGVSTTTLSECLSFYEKLASSNKRFVKITDANLSPENLKYHAAGQIKLISITNFSVKKEKIKIFINNGIHPGEPDGIDASMMLARDFLQKPALRKMLDEIELFIIPIFNTGGAQQRGCCSRANQDGPIEYGFRGNPLNLDLNRDFIKCDALETIVLQDFFQQTKPHFFIDTHVSDGADYQYTMTLIASQHNKLQNEALDQFQQKKLLPVLYQSMKSANEEMCPYVDFDKEVPDSGITSFFDSPRYSTGYTSMFNCFSFVSETHMLKPFNKRVNATYTLLNEIIKFAYNQKPAILEVMRRADSLTQNQKSIALKWALDTNQFEDLDFRGYTAFYATSPVTKQSQLYYNQGAPYQKTIKYFNTFNITKSIDYPKAYVMPYEWYEKLNLQRYHLNIIISKDTNVFVKAYTRVQFTARKNPYEGNIPAVLEYYIKDSSHQDLKGNWVIIPLENNIRYRRFLTEAIEPESPDGFFAWGKMYSFVQQKEGFSDYVWDKRAWEILVNDHSLNENFVLMRDQGKSNFAKNKQLQLDFIYRHSKYYEPTHVRFPIFRIDY